MAEKIISFRELVSALRGLGIPHQKPVIAHASLSAFGELHGGTESLLGGLLAAFDAVMMPAFTYKTMLTPETGPAENGMSYGSDGDNNRMAEFYEPDMPVDRLIGAAGEAMRRHALSRRSEHPILSFSGINVEEALQTQTLEEPLAPIGWLCEHDGWVLLIGVDHTTNTSIHYAERLAGRRQFVRWALTPQGVVECPGFPGCSQGFGAIAAAVDDFTRRTQVGGAAIQAFPLPELVNHVNSLVQRDPQALLCSSLYCPRCRILRDGS